MAHRSALLRLVFGVILVVQSFVGPAQPTAAQVAGGPGSITGNAACVVPPLSVLPGATVTVFSGAAPVASVQADGNGNYVVQGSAANAQYIVRYQQTDGAISCGVAVTTDANGNATAAQATSCPTPDLNNRTWLTPFDLSASSGGVTITDFICKSGQSRWFRVPVLPGQQVTAEVLDPSFDVTLALFKDIRQTADQLDNTTLNAQSVQNLTGSLPHDAGAPDIGSPDIGSPDIGSPDIGSPDIGSPDIGSPDIGSPDIGSPDIGSPDIGSPDIGSPDIDSPDAYSAAQIASILAYSDKPGPASEFVRRHTWDNTGHFYIRVRGHNDAFDETHPFTLRVTVVDRDCSTADGHIQLTSTPPSLAGLPGSTPRTLILTNTARFAQGSDISGLLTSLNAFAARPEVGGAVVDLAADTGLAADYAQWDSLPDCVPAANIVASEIHAVEVAVRAHSPSSLQYVVLVGADHVLPFSRIPDEAGLDNEHDYFPAVRDFTASQASLRTGYFLSQDSYGSFLTLTLRDHVTPSFDVPVGRLVEQVPDIQNMLAAYTASGGVIQPTTALVTGYDFLADSSTVERNDLAASGVTVDTLIQPEGDGPLASTAWHADDLRARLFGPTRYGILDLNAHFSGNTLLAADDASRVRSREVASVTDGRYTNSLILSMGCHSGYNIVDPEATPGTPPDDWAQAFAQQGATLIGGSGYQYGNTPLIKYTEVLMDGITHQFRLGSGAVPLGQAIVNTKRAYVRAGMNGIDEKAVAEVTLYGLPMMAVNLTSGRLPQPTPPAPITPQPGNSAGLSFADLSPSYTLNGHDKQLQIVGGGTNDATYFTATYGSVNEDAQDQSGQPILPQVITDVHASDSSKVARGAVMLSASYTDLTRSLSGANAFRPLVDTALTDARGVRPPYALRVFGPTQLAYLNDLQGQFLVERPFQFKSSLKADGTASVFGTGRRYDSIATRVYYSNRTDPSALAAPPVIYSTVLSQDRSKLLVDVAVGGLKTADVEDVFATFTSDPTDGGNSFYGKWQSIELTAGPSVTNTVGFIRHYTGIIHTLDTGATPATIKLFIQAVGGNALVSLSTNNGNYFKLVTETATLGSPKRSTTLALDQSTYTAPYRGSLTVTSTLTDAVTHTPIAGKTLVFSLGRNSATAPTGSDGRATASLPVLVVPDSPPPRVSVDFAEDTTFLGSGARSDVNITPAATAFIQSPATIAYGSAANIARLAVQTASGTASLADTALHIGLSDGRQLDGITDGFGEVLFDTLDFEGVQPGSYVTSLSYPGNERYAPASLQLTQTVRADGNHSVAFNGSGYGEVRDSPELNVTGDWTLEMWFRDDDPRGFNHDPHELVSKGDLEAPEAPFFAMIGGGNLLVGLRSGGVNYPLTFNLTIPGYSPKIWQHMATTFAASTRTLRLYLDGQFVAQQEIPATSVGNTLPLQIGRKSAGQKLWVGKIDDLRLWNVVRSASQIQSSFRTEFSSVPTGMVANWQFNERLGTFLAYSTVGTHTAVLSTTGSAFSTDVHP